MTAFLLYPTLFGDRIITLGRGIWDHYGTDNFNVDHVTCVCFLSVSLSKEERTSFQLEFDFILTKLL